MTNPSQFAQTPGGGEGPDEETLAAGQAQVNLSDTTDLLDEIDGLLENNAEEFVRAYVQKGGQ